jgi:hypothetical protein
LTTCNSFWVLFLHIADSYLRFLCWNSDYIYTYQCVLNFDFYIYYISQRHYLPCLSETRPWSLVNEIEFFEIERSSTVYRPIYHSPVKWENTHKIRKNPPRESKTIFVVFMYRYILLSTSHTLENFHYKQLDKAGIL